MDKKLWIIGRITLCAAAEYEEHGIEEARAWLLKAAHIFTYPVKTNQNKLMGI